jgi:hypothetical protein
LAIIQLTENFCQVPGVVMSAQEVREMADCSVPQGAYDLLRICNDVIMVVARIRQVEDCYVMGTSGS